MPLLVALASYVGLEILTYFDTIALPRALGLLFVLAVFVGTLAVILCVLAQRRWAAPVAGLALVIVLLLLEPNHHSVARIEARSTPRSMQDALGEWLANRRDIDAYRSRGLPYRIIVASSEGGGIYAAAHAYGTLSAIARNCPTFSQHVFAPVGMPGGAVGNVLFASAFAPEQSDIAPCRSRPGSVNRAPIVTDHMARCWPAFCSSNRSIACCPANG